MKTSRENFSPNPAARVFSDGQPHEGANDNIQRRSLPHRTGGLLHQRFYKRPAVIIFRKRGVAPGLMTAGNIVAFTGFDDIKPLNNIRHYRSDLSLRLVGKVRR